MCFDVILAPCSGATTIAEQAASRWWNGALAVAAMARAVADRLGPMLETDRGVEKQTGRLQHAGGRPGGEVGRW